MATLSMGHRIRLAVLTVGPGPILFGLILSFVAVLLVFSNSNLPSQAARMGEAVPYLVWSASLLASTLTSQAFRPEDRAEMELLASCWRGFILPIRDRVGIVVASILFPCGAALVIVAAQGDPQRWLGYGAFDLATTTLVFSVVALGASYLGRHSMYGTLAALGLWILLFLLNLPASLSTVLPLHFPAPNATVPESWWTARVAMLAAALGCLWLTFRALRDTRRLFEAARTGTPMTSASRPKGAQRRDSIIPRIEVALGEPLGLGRGVFTAGSIYEALQLFLMGWLPIGIVAVALLLSFAALSEADVLQSLATGVPRTFLFVMVVVLPPLLADSVPSDWRSGLQELCLACLSPSTYLWLKVLGANLAVLTAVSLGFLPAVGLFVFTAAQGTPQYLLGFAVVYFLGLLPTAAFVSSLAVLIGSLFPSRPGQLVGVALTLTVFILFAFTSSSPLGRLILPSGELALQVVSHGLEVGAPSAAKLSDIVPLALQGLGLIPPLVSGAAQVAAVWFFARRRMMTGGVWA